MKVIIWVVIFAAIFALYLHSKDITDTNEALTQRTNSNGFIDISPATIPNSNGIVVAAPETYDSKRSQRTEQLLSQLREKNIPFEYRYNLRASIDLRGMDPKKAEQLRKEINEAIQQPPPIVIVNGKIKSRPSLEDIMKEYEDSSGSLNSLIKSFQ